MKKQKKINGSKALWCKLYIMMMSVDRFTKLKHLYSPFDVTHTHKNTIPKESNMIEKFSTDHFCEMFCSHHQDWLIEMIIIIIL